MNNIKKIYEIRRIFTNYDNNECPYCGFDLETVMGKKGKEQQYCDGHEGDIYIRLIDYLEAVREIVFHSNVKKDPIRYRKLSEF